MRLAIYILAYSGLLLPADRCQRSHPEAQSSIGCTVSPDQLPGMLGKGIRSSCSPLLSVQVSVWWNYSPLFLSKAFKMYKYAASDLQEIFVNLNFIRAWRPTRAGFYSDFCSRLKDKWIPAVACLHSGFTPSVGAGIAKVYLALKRTTPPPIHKSSRYICKDLFSISWSVCFVSQNCLKGLNT